jgi:hypothetical protein
MIVTNLKDNLRITPYINVKNRAKELNCNMPDGIAILPLNFEDANSKRDLFYDDNIDTTRKILRSAGIQLSSIEKEDEIYPHLVKHSIEWIGPTILFTATIVFQNPHLISLTLNVVANYLTELFKANPLDKKNAHLSLVIELPSGQSKKINYDGPPDGLRELPDIIRSLNNEEKS